MPVSIPSEDEVLAYFKSLSNWGRWGGDDQLGTLNLLSPDSARRGFSTVTEHVTVSCARTVAYEPSLDAPKPALHFMTHSGEADNPRVAVDFVGMVFHGATITHVDSLAHFFWEGRMYNGRPSSLVSTSEGATAGSIELAGGGIVTRGILVDAPLIRGVRWLERGEGVMPDDILEAERRHGFRITEGDALLIRTGQLTRRGVEGPADPDAGSTACQAACLPLFHERGIAVLGTDTGNDVKPTGYPSLTNPIHQVGIVAMGLWILDNANLDDLAMECRKRGRYEFLLMTSPLKLSNTTGSPVNPLAVF